MKLTTILKVVYGLGVVSGAVGLLATSTAVKGVSQQVQKLRTRKPKDPKAVVIDVEHS